MNTDVILAKLKLQCVSDVVLHETTLVSCSTFLPTLGLPEGITKLHDGCLSGQVDLEHVILPNSILEVGEAPFSNCSSLKSIVCYSDLRKYDARLKYANNAEVVYVHRNN